MAFYWQQNSNDWHQANEQSQKANATQQSSNNYGYAAAAQSPWESLLNPQPQQRQAPFEAYDNNVNTHESLTSGHHSGHVSYDNSMTTVDIPLQDEPAVPKYALNTDMNHSAAFNEINSTKPQQSEFVIEHTPIIQHSYNPEHFDLAPPPMAPPSNTYCVAPNEETLSVTAEVEQAIPVVDTAPAKTIEVESEDIEVTILPSNTAVADDIVVEFTGIQTNEAVIPDASSHPHSANTAAGAHFMNIPYSDHDYIQPAKTSDVPNSESLDDKKAKSITPDLGAPIAESTPVAVAKAPSVSDMKAELDINVQTPLDTPKKDLQTQLSDTQNSDRTSDGFVKVASFNNEMEHDFTTTNPVSEWQQNSYGKERFTVDDYREQEANDSTTSSMRITRSQISNNYYEYRKRIPEILGRRSGRAPTPKQGFSFRSNPLFEEGRRSVTGRSVHASTIPRPPSAYHENSYRSNAMHDVNTSLNTNPDVSLDFTFDRTQSPYGDGFVENSRRSRLIRNTHNNRQFSEQSSNKSSAFQTGRRSVTGFGENRAEDYSRRRPQSSYDAKSIARMERSGIAAEQFDAYNSPGSSESADGAESEVDAEMAQYHAPIQNAHQLFTQADIYLIGTLRVPLAKFVATIRKFPPPPCYYSLPSHEKVAFIFYTALWQRNYYDVDGFHKKFNREFFTLTADGMDDEEALYKICADMQTRYAQLNKERYNNTQKQLFSDERDSHDDEERPSERGSVYGDRHEDGSETGSAELAHRGPLKYSAPHSKIHFASNGQLFIISKADGPTTIKVLPIANVLQDDHSLRLIESIRMFRGPLNRETRPNQVTLYIERQVDKIMRSDIAVENPTANDVVDCLLIWQLLKKVVQQQGNVTGPDIAELLLAANTGAADIRQSPSETSSTKPVVDSSIQTAFNEYLLKGHVEEAIELALRYEMYTDALILARRIDPSRLPAIEERYINAMSQDNPVATLLTVAANQKAPVLVNPKTESGNWRSHAAIILANLSTKFALSMVFDLGKVLAQKEYNAAADFCFLAVALLDPHFNVFVPPAARNSAEVAVRQNINLIHANLPDDALESTQCRFEFSLTDLHATEIFGYGISLARGTNDLATSIDFQIKRIQYSRLLAETGFPDMAFYYAVDIAQKIWPFYYNVPIRSLHELCLIGEETVLASGASSEYGAWIPQLQELVKQLRSQKQMLTPSTQVYSSTTNIAPNVLEPTMPKLSDLATDFMCQQQNLAQTVPQPVQQPTTHHTKPAASSEYATRSRISSLSSQAADWHNQQDPINIHPIQALESGPEKTSRPQTIASEQGATTKNICPEPVPKVVHNSTIQESVNNSVPQPIPQPVYTPPSIPEPAPAVPAPAVAMTSFASTQSAPKPANDNKPLAKTETTSKKSMTRSSGSWLSSMARKLTNAKHGVHLPDDTKKSIVYDQTLGRWVGEGVEEEETVAPPPMIPQSSQQPEVPESITEAVAPVPSYSAGGLRAARRGGASRYFNAATGTAAPVALVAPQASAMPVPTQFTWVPTMPESDEVADPFSAAAAAADASDEASFPEEASQR